MNPKSLRLRQSTTECLRATVFIVCLVWVVALGTWLAPGAPRIQPWHSDETQLTVIVNTFKREDLLRQAVQRYSQCDVVARVHVNWAESTTPPNVAQDTCCGKLVTFATPLVTHNDSTLNTRFLPIPDLTTEAVLNIDDDIAVSCGALERTLAAWRRNPAQLTGWFPRLATDLSSKTPQKPRYRSKFTTLLLRARYSIVLTKGAIMHEKYLRAYSETMPAEVRDMVARERNCEDLAMQFLVAQHTNTAPQFAWEPWLRDAGAGFTPQVPGISSAGQAHFDTRSQCLEGLRSHFGLPQSYTLLQRSVALRPLLRLSPFLDALGTLLPFTHARLSGLCKCRIRR